MNIFQRSKLITIVLPLLLAPMVGCESTPTQSKFEPVTEYSGLEHIEQMIKHAQQLQSPERESLLIDAANILLENQKPAQAQSLLKTIKPGKLDPDNKLKLILALARLNLMQGDIEQAKELLNSDRLGLLAMSNSLTPEQLNQVSLLRAEVWEQDENFLAAARERIFVAPMLTDPDLSQQNQDQIWADLILLPQETLTEIASQAAIPEMQGWLELAWIHKGLQDNLDQQLEALQKWQQSHSTHPAATNLPTSLQLLTELSTNRHTRIALLLPTGGKLKTAADAILNGFISAHKVANENNPQTQNEIDIRVYDSSDQSTFSNTYNQAVADGAEIIIGPLQKENLRSLIERNEDLPVTTIALNRDSDAGEAPSNLIQFSLSPEDDAQQVALHAKAYDYQRAAVLYQDNPWWARAYGAFSEQWLAQAGEITSASSYENQSKMARATKEMLLVHLSELRAQQLRSITGKKIEFHPRRRQDIDFIFLMATPEQARQIRPLLDFYYAKDIPVLASSTIYSGESAPRKDKDLNGVEFCDIPWLLDNPDAIKKAMQSAWPNGNPRYARLNAMGVDAYRLQQRINLLINVPETSLFGATGILNLGPNNHIQRTLSWAVIQDGLVTPLPKLPEQDTLPLEREPSALDQGRNAHKQNPDSKKTGRQSS